MSEGKALALGSYSEVKYHPFAGVDHEIKRILSPDLQVEASEDYSLLNKDNLEGLKLVIAYTEFSDQKIAPEQSAALLSYVAGAEVCSLYITESPCSGIRSWAPCWARISPIIRNTPPCI